jgi:hypothetical protein
MIEKPLREQLARLIVEWSRHAAREDASRWESLQHAAIHEQRALVYRHCCEGIGTILASMRDEAR